MRYAIEPPICKKCGQPKTRSKSGRLRCNPCERAYRIEYYQKNIEHERKRGRDRMKRYRSDPIKNEKIKASQRKCYKKNGNENQKKRLAKMKAEDPWRYKANRIHPSVKGKLNKNDLKSIWDRQNGKCALTGRELEIFSMELDHIVPLAKGGSSTIDNLQWTCKEANQAKKDLLDSEFIALCKEVIAFRS